MRSVRYMRSKRCYNCLCNDCTVYSPREYHRCFYNRQYGFEAARVSRIKPWACSTAHRSNRPDHWDGRSAVGQLSTLSSRTKWQRLPAGDTLRSVLPAGNRCYFVLYWIRMKVVQQLTCLTLGLFDR